jgi:hypothetical protein
MLFGARFLQRTPTVAGAFGRSRPNADIKTRPSSLYNSKIFLAFTTSNKAATDGEAKYHASRRATGLKF